MVDPHQFFAYLSGKLSARLIDSVRSLHDRIAESYGPMDLDARYRLYFSCYTDTWRVAVTRLRGDAHAIVIDLRGFTDANTDCAYEIQQILNLVPLRNVLFVTSSQDDDRRLKKWLEDAAGSVAAASPNQNSNDLHAVVCRLARDADLPQFVRAAFARAEAEQPRHAAAGG